VAIGDLRFTDALVTTTAQEIEPTGRYHGVLGLSIFDGYHVTIDLARERLVLETAGGDPLRRGPAPLRPPLRPVTGSPYWSVQSQMLVEATTADGRTGLFLFDTGATASLLSLDFADAAKAWIGGKNQARGYGGVLRDAREVRGVKLRFQGLETGGSPMIASDLAQRSRLGGVEVSGYLGLDCSRGPSSRWTPSARRCDGREAGKALTLTAEKPRGRSGLSAAAQRRNSRAGCSRWGAGHELVARRCLRHLPRRTVDSCPAHVSRERTRYQKPSPGAGTSESSEERTREIVSETSPDGGRESRLVQRARAIRRGRRTARRPVTGSQLIACLLGARRRLNTLG
jgi:hypothetical protein